MTVEGAELRWSHPKIGFVQSIAWGTILVMKLAIAAGYDGIEPWIREMEDYEKAGGRLEELGKQIEDNGLEVISAIGEHRESKNGLYEAFQLHISSVFE